MSLCFCRLFYSPQPPVRAILDAVSSFSAAVHRSLQAGIISQRIIRVEFPRHVYNFLFNGKGSSVSRKPGRLYERSDFTDEFFNDGHFQIYNKHNEGCSISFPIYMYSFVKFSSKHYSKEGHVLPRGFTETLMVKVVKIYMK